MAKKKVDPLEFPHGANGPAELRDHGDNAYNLPRPVWVPEEGSVGADNYDAAQDDWLEAVAPTLHQFLILRGWGGKQRKPGTIRIFAEEGRWKACLNDNENGRYAFISGESLQGLLESVEKGLAGKGLDWRVNKDFKKSGR